MNDMNTTAEHATHAGHDDVLDTIKSAEKQAMHDIEQHAHRCAIDLQAYKDQKEVELKEYEEGLKASGMEKIKKEKESKEQLMETQLKDVEGELKLMVDKSMKQKEKVVTHIIESITKKAA